MTDIPLTPPTPQKRSTHKRAATTDTRTTGTGRMAEGRERVVARQETDEDQVLVSTLRPARLTEFIGQPELVDNIKIAIQAAKERGEPVEHILLSGPPGVGKTTLAGIVAREMGAKLVATSGPAIERAGDLIGILTNLGEGDVLFIDEIHRLSRVVEEFLYPAMENNQIDFVIDKGPYAKTIKFSLKPFTLVGATTRSGLLSSPMRSRFGMHFHLRLYQPDELVRIVLRSAGLLGVSIEDDAALEIASRSRGTPRIANRLLRRVRDYTQVKADGKVTRALADEALLSQGIDAHGLDDLDRRVLTVILTMYDGGPIGLDSLAATVNEELDTLTDVVEPYLIQSGFQKRTPRGRMAGRRAFEHLGIAPARSDNDLFDA